MRPRELVHTSHRQKIKKPCVDALTRERGAATKQVHRLFVDPSKGKVRHKLPLNEVHSTGGFLP